MANDSDLVRVGMTLTDRDFANAETIRVRFGLRSRAQAVSVAQSLSVSILDMVADGGEFFIREKGSCMVQRVVILGLPR
jgi:uncharacterized protein (UPF0303 family)